MHAHSTHSHCTCARTHSVTEANNFNLRHVKFKNLSRMHTTMSARKKTEWNKWIYWAKLIQICCYNWLIPQRDSQVRSHLIIIITLKDSIYLLYIQTGCMLLPHLVDWMCFDVHTRSPSCYQYILGLKVCHYFRDQIWYHLHHIHNQHLH